MAIQLPNPGLGDGQTGDNEFVMWTKVKDNFSNTTHAASKLVGESAGNVLEVGAFGIGATSTSRASFTATTLNTSKDGFIRLNGEHAGVIPNSGYSYNGLSIKDGAGGTVLLLPTAVGGAAAAKTHGYRFVTYSATGASLLSAEIYTTENTNKGTNGELSAKSPVTHLFRDRVEHTGDEKELQPIKFVKNSEGNYTLKNTTGLAKEGWYIIIPKDANGNPLVAVEYEDNDGEINVRTYKRKFDYEKAAVIADHDNPMDIPETRWIDLRFNDDPSLYDEVTDEPIE